MTWLKYLNPLSWLPEDPVVQCGWRMFRLRGGNPKDDPYYPFCAWDDAGTSEGSFAGEVVPLQRWIDQGIIMIEQIQNQFEVGSDDWLLGEKYKEIWPHVVGLFWDGKK